MDFLSDGTHLNARESEQVADWGGWPAIIYLRWKLRSPITPLYVGRWIAYGQHV